MSKPDQITLGAMQWVATELFKREEVPKAPSADFYCREAERSLGDASAGPWLRYGSEGLWQCGLCYTDEYLSEYGNKYLLGPVGMVEIMTALKAHGVTGFYIDHEPVPHVQWSCAMFPKQVITTGDSPMEAVLMGAYAVLRVNGMLRSKQ